jgi:predicted sugar kinase
MQIEIAAPALLTLGLARFEDGAAALLGASLRYPALNLSARAADHLLVTGARADLGQAAAQRFLGTRGLPLTAEVEIELAVPALMGLGSEALMTLATAQAAAWVHGLPFEDPAGLAPAAGLGPADALAVHAYAQGGVLLVEAPGPAGAPPAVLRRQPLAHKDPAAWVFVLYLPRPPAGTSPALESERLAALLGAAPHLSPESGRLLEQALWPALEGDDIARFGQALQMLQQLNQVALESAGGAAPLSDDERGILEIYAASSAVAWGRSPTGLALWALIQGAAPSVALRKQVVDRVGIHAGTVMGSIVDNRGARYAVHDKPPLYTGASPLVARTALEERA